MSDDKPILTLTPPETYKRIKKAFEKIAVLEKKVERLSGNSSGLPPAEFKSYPVSPFDKVRDRCAKCGDMKDCTQVEIKDDCKWIKERELTPCPWCEGTGKLTKDGLTIREDKIREFGKSICLVKVEDKKDVAIMKELNEMKEREKCGDCPHKGLIDYVFFELGALGKILLKLIDYLNIDDHDFPSLIEILNGFIKRVEGKINEY